MATNPLIASESTVISESGDRDLRLGVLLIGNYPNDRQESMQRFADMMSTGLRAAGVFVELVVPPTFFGRLKKSGSGFGKWLGYVDKYLLFPIQLRLRLLKIRSPVVVHICDHSNAPYAAHVGGTSCVITCHDLGAVRGALGEATYCPASATGKILQRWILASLLRTTTIVCDSSATQSDARRLLGARSPKTEVVLLGLNQTFVRREEKETRSVLVETVPQVDFRRPYLLHVGSSLTRKNRDGVIRVFHRVANRWDGQLVFAGEGLTPELVELADHLGISSRILVIPHPSSKVLEALYNRAFALLFPSRFEGFGWPVVEAQACGCPVLCSDAASLPEVAGKGAFIRPVEDEAGFAEDVLRLTEPAVRAALVARGFENLPRFETRRMVESYLRIYREAAGMAS